MKAGKSLVNDIFCWKLWKKINLVWSAYGGNRPYRQSPGYANVLTLSLLSSVAYLYCRWITLRICDVSEVWSSSLHRPMLLRLQPIFVSSCYFYACDFSTYMIKYDMYMIL